MSKQLIPVPEYLTALSVCSDGMFDVVGNGDCPFFVLEAEALPDGSDRLTNRTAKFEYDSFLFVPTVYCPECRNRMIVNDIVLEKGENAGVVVHDPERLTYTCRPCRIQYNRNHGWTKGRID